MTLADKNYVEQAKQLFSSVYWNAGWDGDYMLLCHGIPEKELKWFRNKGILVKKCMPLKGFNLVNLPIIVYAKFYLFTEEFKKWETILYLDSDIIVKKSLNYIKKLKGFWAAKDILNPNISDQFGKIKLYSNAFRGFTDKYELSKMAFNAGVFIFDSKIINNKTYPELLLLSEKYSNATRYNEQGILNLYFYDKWKKLPVTFNVFANMTANELKRHSATIIHFTGPKKPWAEKKGFYNEWKKNLQKADFIELNNRQNIKDMTYEEIVRHSRKIKICNLIYLSIQGLLNLNRTISKIGIYINKKYPRLYYFLKSNKIK